MRNIPALILSVASVCMFALNVHIGLDECAWHRLVYQICHVNAFHLLVNTACLYSICASNYRTKWWVWLLAFLISAIAPTRSIPTEGMSGIVYAVFGILSWQAMSKKKFHGFVALYLTVGALIPGVNNMLHCWCYALGVISGLYLYRKEVLT